MERFESLNFDIGVINFDTMKLIFYAIMSQALIPQGFLDIEKERKLQYLWYHNFRSYLAMDYKKDIFGIIAYEFELLHNRSFLVKSFAYARGEIIYSVNCEI